MGRVPDTTIFSFADVKAVMSNMPNDLVAAFNMSTDVYFNPAYKGSKNELLNFRDYWYETVSTNYGNCYMMADGSLYDGASVFTVTSSTNWTALKSASWIQLIGTSGASGGTFTIRAAYYNGTRSGLVTVTCGRATVVISVVQSNGYV